MEECQLKIKRDSEIFFGLLHADAHLGCQLYLPPVCISSLQWDHSELSKKCIDSHITRYQTHNMESISCISIYLRFFTLVSSVLLPPAGATGAASVFFLSSLVGASVFLVD